MDDSGVTRYHDDTRDDEGDNQLIPGEVDTEQESLQRWTKHHFSPNIIIRIIAVGDRGDVGAVSIVVGEDILQEIQLNKNTLYSQRYHLGPNYGKCQKYW